MTDEGLDLLTSRLRDLAGAIDHPPTPPLRAAVMERLQADRRDPGSRRPGRRWTAGPRRRVAVALAVLAAVLGGSAALPPWRDAVAGWLGLRGVVIEHTAPPLPIPSRTAPPASGTPRPPGAPLGLGDPVAVAPLPPDLGFTPLVPVVPGRPDAAWVQTSGGAGKILTLVYAPGPGRPAASADSGVSLLVTEFRADLYRPFVEKFVGPDATVASVTVGGEPGYWLAGAPHAIAFRDATGNIRDDTLRLAGNTLVWQHGPLLLRVEGAPSLDAAMAIAASMR